MKGSAQGLFFNLCGWTHGSERDFSFNSRTSEISRYLQVLCRLDCSIPVCCWQALFYSSHWQEKVTAGSTFLVTLGLVLLLVPDHQIVFSLLADVSLIDVDTHVKNYGAERKSRSELFPSHPPFASTDLWLLCEFQQSLTSFTGRKAVFHG